jgi:hypothetical protein
LGEEGRWAVACFLILPVVRRSLMTQQSLTRREFTVETALAMLAGVTITIAGCGNDDPGPGPSGAGDRAGTVSVSAGHSHTARITAAELSSGNAIAITITGGDHTHTVALTQNELAQISAGTRVQKESSSDQAHTHFVTFN